jgi:hypothetical protein
MARSRLFTTLVLMGASLTGTAAIATVAATQVAGCSSDDGLQGFIDMYQSHIDAAFPHIDMAHIDFTNFIDMAIID